MSSAQNFEYLTNMCRAAEKKLKHNLDHYRVLYSKLIVVHQVIYPSRTIKKTFLPVMFASVRVSLMTLGIISCSASCVIV